MPNKRSSIWKYFDDCNDPDEKKVICKFCHKTYRGGSISNLKHHLTHKHFDEIDIFKVKPPKYQFNGLKTSLFVWKYFNKFDEPEKVAICKFCSKLCSYNSTINNLRSHLSSKHGDSVEELYLESKLKTESNVEEENSNDSNTDDNGDDALSISSTSANYFEQDGERVRCLVCRMSLPATKEDLHNHLKDKHPAIAGENSGDESDENGGEVYTEVVYLDDDRSERPKKMKAERQSTSVSRISEGIPKKKRKKSPERTREARLSSSDDELLIKELRRKNKEEEELHIFGNYVTSLLKSVPAHVSTKLQMDIVNLIMTAKLKCSQAESNKLLLDSLNTVPGGILVVQDKNSDRNCNDSVTVVENTAVDDASNHSYSITINGDC